MVHRIRSSPLAFRGLLCLACLCLFAASQQSQDTQIREARRAYLEGRFEESIQQLSPLLESLKDDTELRDVTFLLGLNHLALRNDAEGLEWFRAAVRHDPTFAPTTDRFSASVVRAYEDVRSDLVGEMVIESEPPGAEVSIAGRSRGQTPYRGADLAGDYIVRLELEGFQTEERPVTVRAGQQTDISIVMNPLRDVPAEESEAQTSEPSEKKGGSKLPLVLAGVGGAAGVGIAVAGGGGGGGEGPSQPVPEPPRQTITFQDQISCHDPFDEHGFPVTRAGTIDATLEWVERDADIEMSLDQTHPAYRDDLAVSTPTGPTSAALTYNATSTGSYRLFPFWKNNCWNERPCTCPTATYTITVIHP